MATYEPIPLSAFQEALEPKGFSMDASGPEIVFARPHERIPGLTIKIYTSITRSGRCEGVGEDAVRACVVYSSPDGRRTKGLLKSKRVNRIGSPKAVVERALERARDMWKAALSLPGAAPIRLS